jgi:hypothetical protein
MTMLILNSGDQTASEKCYPCRRARVLPMSPTVPVSRKTLSSILKGRAEVSPEMAERLSITFDTSAVFGGLAMKS